MKKKLISILTPCFNEEENIAELCSRVRTVMLSLAEQYDYEHIVIDNASTDTSVAELKKIATHDKHLKIIVNTRNFGPVRSPYHGMLSAHGDVVILTVADLQDPPELIPELIKKWENGFLVVLATKPRSEESVVMQKIRKFYYSLLNSISDVPLENNATGSGLFDKKVISALRDISDPNPYFRGLVCDLGFSRCTVDFVQPKRFRGKSKISFYGLLDHALLGITKHSKLPLRIMTMVGLSLGALTFLASIVFLVLKLLFWNSFNMGMAPLLIGMFFIASVQLFSLGLIGEYVGAILTHVRNMPLVVEKERFNFAQEENKTSAISPPLSSIPQETIHDESVA